MILNALYDLYQRRMADPDPQKRLPVYGFEDKPIPWIIVIDADGKLVHIRSTLNDAKKPVAQTYLVPQAVKRSANIAANLLWDTLEYGLGVASRGKPERVREQHAAFRARIRALPVQDDMGILAINRFLDQFQVDQVANLPCWPTLLETNPNLSFQLQGEPDLICQRPRVMAACEPLEQEDEARRVCLITGQYAPFEQLHTAIKGVWGAQSVGANIVSFNAPSYCSWGKEQGDNSPVSKKAAFGYTTALNALLARESGQRVQVADASTVFWAEKSHDLEQAIPDCFGEAPKDEPDRGKEAVKRLYQWVESGQAQNLDGDTRFFVLGLAPNAARIAVRFWETLPLRDLARRTVQHFDDLALVHAGFEPDYPSLFRLLAACAVQGKADNIPPNLGGEVMRAVLTGGPYPASWLSAAVRRCRAEQEVTYLRAAVIKACLNRQVRRQQAQVTPLPPSRKELTTMLDPENLTIGYCLGRLFAALERLQEQAADGTLNSTIRDRFFGAAASSPLMVFTTLMRLHQHHLAKLRKGGGRGYGAYVHLDKLITDIMAKVERFPTQMSLEDQGYFSIGYYHQRQDFFKPNPTSEK